MKKLLVLFVLLFNSYLLHSQCGDALITFNYQQGDCGDNAEKIVRHFSPTGKIILEEFYQSNYPNYLWTKISRTLWTYDANDNLASIVEQGVNGNNWVDEHRTLFSYNTFGSILTQTSQNWVSNTWQTTGADTNVYDSQNNLLSDAHYNPNPYSKNLYINNATDSITVHQQGDSTGAWVNDSKFEKHFTGSQLTQITYYDWINNVWVGSSRVDFIFSPNVQTINYTWLNSSWTPVNKQVKYYTGTVLDSVSNYIWSGGNWSSDNRTLHLFSPSVDSTITQIMISSWVNQTLFVEVYNASHQIIDTYTMHWDTNWVYDAHTSFFYDANGNVIRENSYNWQDTIWVNGSSVIYEYDLLNRVDHTYNLSGNDTGWIYTSLNIRELDQYGYPTYEEEFGAYYNGLIVDWYTYNGPSYYAYDSLGHLLSHSADPIPGGPYNSNYTYWRGYLFEGHSYSESMGGLTCEHDIYSFFTDVNGDSMICAGSTTTLYADSCTGYQYLWSNGATTASITISTPGDYFVSITPPGGSSYSSPTIHVDVAPFLPYMSTGPDSTMNVCSNEYVQFNLPSQGGVTYQWYRNDTALSGYDEPDLTFYGTYLRSGVYYLTATNTCGSDTSAFTTINLIPYPPVPTVTPNGNTTVCAGDTITLTSSPGLQYEWNPGGQTTQSIQVYNSGYYSVSIFDSAGCSSNSNSVHVTRSNNPLNITITLQNGVLQTNYGSCQWLLDGDTIPGATSQTYIPTISGTYTLAVYFYPGCIFYSNSIYINTATVNVSIPNPKYICAGSSGTIGGTAPVFGGTPPYSYSWSTDNINFIPGSSQRILNNQTVNQTYYLKVTDALGNTDIDSVHVIVDYPVKPILSPSTYCHDSYNTLRVSNHSIFSVQKWIAAGDTFATTNTFWGIYNSGIYQVLITDQYGCQVWSDPDTIDLHPRPAPPVINASLDSNACYNGQGTLWTNYVQGSTYKWMQYPNIELGTDTFLNVNMPVTYELEYTDSNGCANSNYFEFDLLNQNIQLAITSTDSRICDNDSANLTASQISGWTYEWFDENNQSIANSTSILITTPGQYTCIATSSTGCVASGSSYIYQATGPAVSIVDSNGVLNAPHLTQYYSYQWYRNGIAIPGAMNRYFVPTHPGSYYVEINNWGSGWNQCPGYSNTIYLGICSVNAADAIVCSGQCDGQLIASGIGSGFIDYHWSNGSLTDSTMNLCAGQYIITMTDSLGCTAIDTANVLTDSVNFSLTNFNPCNGCFDGYIIINGGFTSVTWQPSIGMLSGDTIKNLTADIYNICVTNSNQCTSCMIDTLSFSVGINANQFQALNYFPNPVTDKFTITGLPLFESFESRIYDKTGRIVRSIVSAESEFDVSGLASGIYTIELRNSKNQFRLIFIKE